MLARNHKAAFAALLLVASLACGEDADTAAPDAALPAPEALTADALSPISVKLTWKRGDLNGVAGFRVKRRTNFTSEWETVAENLAPTGPGANATFLDTAAEPDTYYGYRVFAVTAAGTESLPSTTAGLKTPPPPTLVIGITTDMPNPASADPDGYQLVVRGPKDTLTAPIDVNGRKEYRDIRPGVYSVVLRGISKNCNPRNGDDSVKTATVVDQGTSTVSAVAFDVTCRDPSRGSLVVSYQQLGDTSDPTGVRLSVTGLVIQDGTPNNERVYAKQETFTTKLETRRYDNLRQGEYEAVLEDIDPACKLNRDPTLKFIVKALSVDSVRYTLTCTKPVVDDPTKPLVLDYVWSKSPAQRNDAVSLLARYDTRALPGQQVRGVQINVRYDFNTIRYDSTTFGDFSIVQSQLATPGIIVFSAAQASGGRSGLISLGRLWFTVIGGAGATTTTTELTEIVAPDFTNLRSKTKVREAQLTIAP
jgi:hypothetical protein